MRISSMATVYAAIASLFIGAVARAEDSTASVPQAEPAITDTQWDFKLSFDETVQVYTFEGSDNTLVGFNQSLLLDFKKFDLGVNLPIYSQDGTGIGDIDVHASAPVFKGDNSLFKDWTVALGGGIYAPVGSEKFRSENVNPYVNAAFACSLFGLDFVQTAEYTFVGGGFYAPTLGAKTDSDILGFTTDLTVFKTGDLKVGLALDQYYFVDSGDAQVFLGPEAKWELWGLDLHASLLLPIHQDVSTPESEMLLTAGFGFEF